MKNGRTFWDWLSESVDRPDMFVFAILLSMLAFCTMAIVGAVIAEAVKSLG